MLQVRLSRLIYGSFLVGTLSAILPLAIEQPATAQAPTSPSLPPNTAAIVEQLVGRWELRLAGGEPARTAIFARDGQLFVFDPGQTDRAVRYAWSIDLTQPQPQVVINFGVGLLVGTPSASEMQLRAVPLVTDGNSQPTPELIIQARRVSADSSLPAGVTVMDEADAYQSPSVMARQAQARYSVAAINRSQQAYFIERQQFGTSQAIAAASGLNLQSDNYDFQIFLSEEGRVANALAIPKQNDFNAYVGRVTTRSTADGAVSVTILCESSTLTQTPPALPVVAGGALQCPDGYQVLN